MGWVLFAGAMGAVALGCESGQSTATGMDGAPPDGAVTADARARDARAADAPQADGAAGSEAGSGTDGGGSMDAASGDGGSSSGMTDAAFGDASTDATPADGATDGGPMDGGLLDGAGPDGASDAAPDGSMGQDSGPAELEITTGNPLPDGVVGQSYTTSFATAGGTGSDDWTDVSLPPWGTLSSSGQFSGTPPAPGNYTLTVRVDSGTQSDEETFDLSVYGVLELNGDPPVTGTDGLDLDTFLDGGKAPIACTVYTGPGEGTVPSGVQQDSSDATGCTFEGTPDGSNPPGGYGFLVIVEDILGQRIEVPVFYAGDACNTSAVMIDPEANVPRVETAGSAYAWSLTVDEDIDAPCETTQCNSCGACWNMSMTASPLATTQDLECANPGDVCSDCNSCTTAVQTCPDLLTMTRSVDVKSHSPLRSGAAAWLSIEVTLDYSGTVTSPLSDCGNKHWECHLETLEVP